MADLHVDDAIFVEREPDDSDLVFNLLGAAIAEYPPSQMAVLNVLSGAWNSLGKGGVRIVPVNERVYSIMVSSEALANFIINSGPWTVENRLINVVPWPRDLSTKEVDFTRISFWIQVHNVPLGWFSERSARNVGRMVGDVIEVEDPRKIPRDFLRVKVKINGRRSLVAGFWHPKEGSNRRKIKIKFEKTQGFLFSLWENWTYSQSL